MPPLQDLNLVHEPDLMKQDPGSDDQDSALDDNQGSTASLTSSILENTRYHVQYLLLGGKLDLAPLSRRIDTVIDIGTGTGIWAIDSADEYPNVSVTGTDVSPIQPSWILPNLQFQIDDDCTQKWTFKENSADYVIYAGFKLNICVRWSSNQTVTAAKRTEVAAAYNTQ
ncbi:hypothetical protein QQZ08_005682 [Neonectria magnoliae]|uniref:Methyltransferase domain-containing protein n=1 Tax=Neonectria magnoliae TaxID=2732573 RepID=A0ABR1I407_9HYPO